MTDKHPLTDEIINSIAELGFDYNHDMREAANFQLRRDIFWWHRRLLTMKMSPKERDLLIKDFREAMRPQEDN